MNILNQEIGTDFALYNGDSCEILPMLPERSIDYCIHSPPFASLYTYSNSPRDLGNCRDYDDFFVHFDFIIQELARVMKPGRNVSMHCMLLPTSKSHHGFIGLQDFRGDLIRAYQKHGFIFHSEVVIWKDPVTAMQRTKALGLLHKTVRGNGAMSRQGIPDYLVTMRAPGECEENVIHYRDEEECSQNDGDESRILPVSKWQQYASPVWMDINPNDTLQGKSAREDADERHICPLQLEVIRRGVELWTNPGDTVLSPFAGIGSEGYVSLGMNRKFVGIELKESYYKQAAINLQNARGGTMDIFEVFGE
jgi:DNA modification methylase